MYNIYLPLTAIHLNFIVPTRSEQRQGRCVLPPIRPNQRWGVVSLIWWLPRHCDPSYVINNWFYLSTMILCTLKIKVTKTIKGRTFLTDFNIILRSFFSLNPRFVLLMLRHEEKKTLYKIYYSLPIIINV